MTGSSRAAGSCQTGRNLGFHHPLRSPVSNSPRCPPPPRPHLPASTASSRSSSARSRSSSTGSTTRCRTLRRSPPVSPTRSSTRSGWRSSSPVSASSTCCPATTSGSPASSTSGSRTRRPMAPRWARSSTSSASRPTCRPTRSLPIHNQLAKLLGRLSQRAHEVVELIWSASGAMNEHLAMSAYREMGIVVDELGERSLYETLFKRLRTHEAAHKGFYAAYAREVAQGMHRWQRRLARAIIVHTYAPVGAGARVDKPALGSHGSGPRPRRWLGGEGGRPGPAHRREAAGRRRTPAERSCRDAMAECVESVEARPIVELGRCSAWRTRSVRRSRSGGRLVGRGGRRSDWPTASGAR